MDRHLTFACSGLANSAASRRFLATHDVRSRNDAPDWERLHQKIGLVRYNAPRAGVSRPIVQHSNKALSASLVSMGPKLIGYFLAFALLGILLNSHWRQFQNIVYADWVLYFINILFLSFVVLVPFATTAWTTYPDTSAGVCSSTASCSSRGSLSTQTGRT